MNDQKLKEVANNVIKAAGLEDEEKFGSVIIVLMVISIILTCVRVMQECHKNKTNFSDTQSKSNFYGAQIKELSIRRSWLTKMRIKKIIRKELSPEDYRKYANQITDALLNYGENITEEETYALVEAANV